MNGAEEGLGLVRCVADIIAAFHDAEASVERIKIKCAQSRVPPPSRVLEDSIEQAPEEIEREKKRGIGRFGKAFEDGDRKSIIELQLINIQLQTSLLSKLRNAAHDDKATADFKSLIEAADSGRDRTIQVLLNLEQRLVQTAPIPRSNPRETEELLPLRPGRNPSQAQHPSPTSPGTKHYKTWLRDDSGASGEEDAKPVAQQRPTPIRSQSHSLLNVLKHRRTLSGSSDNLSDQNDSWRLSASYLPLHLPRSRDSRDETSKASSGDRDGHSHHPYRLSEEPQDRRVTVSVPSEAPKSWMTRTLSSSPNLARTNSGSLPTPFRSSKLPQPNPDNDYLGFCKGAVQLQNGDKKAMQQAREFNAGWSSSSVHYLTCSNSKCAFFSRINMDVIWTKVWKPDENTTQSLGLQFRWAFLAKSHTLQQGKLKESEFSFKCLFCVFLGEKAPPVLRGTDAYLQHVSQEHRGKALSELILYKTCCVNDSVYDDDTEYDINLFPINRDKDALPIRSSKNEAPPPEMQDSMFAGDDDQPWGRGLSNFHYDEEFERIERCE